MISVMLPLGCCRGRGREVTGEGHALPRPTPLSNTRYWSGTSLACFHKGASATPSTRQTASAPVTCHQHHILPQQFDNKTDKPTTAEPLSSFQESRMGALTVSATNVSAQGNLDSKHQRVTQQKATYSSEQASKSCSPLCPPTPLQYNSVQSQWSECCQHQQQ